jgi:hypothetical protein
MKQTNATSIQAEKKDGEGQRKVIPDSLYNLSP